MSERRWVGLWTWLDDNGVEDGLKMLGDAGSGKGVL